ncbi:MAG: CaiB/BaiF CoA transferase family protein [Burkholderiales bacterium]
MARFSPLAGVRVLDLSKILAGPICTQILGDMGADVVKVEPCDRGDDTRHWPPFEGDQGTIFLAVNRNKRSLALDLKSAGGRAVCERLARSADVVVESFGPGVAARLGVDFESLVAQNPRLVHCGISGFGTVGPLREGKGYDVVLQAFTGMLSITGEPGGPPLRSPFSPVDQGTGMHAAIGILAGLLERARTGRAVKVEAALFDTAVAFLGYFLQGFWQRGTEPMRVGSGHESLCPYQAFETSDAPVILGVANDALWREFCRVAGDPALADREPFRTNADRVRHRAETVGVVQAIMRTRSRAQWIKDLGAAGIPCSPVHNLAELSAHPHTAESGMVFEYPSAHGTTLKGVAQALRFDGARQELERPPPRLGEHSCELLREAGYAEEEITALITTGAVATAHKA